jgi:hypothetical protein
MSGSPVALPAEETGRQITLICTPQTVTATRRDLRQIGGSVRVAPDERRSRDVVRGARAPGVRASIDSGQQRSQLWMIENPRITAAETTTWPGARSSADA